MYFVIVTIFRENSTLLLDKIFARFLCKYQQTKLYVHRKRMSQNRRITQKDKLRKKQIFIFHFFTS